MLCLLFRVKTIDVFYFQYEYNVDFISINFVLLSNRGYKKGCFYGDIQRTPPVSRVA
jgi:hypothetical protein